MGDSGELAAETEDGNVHELVLEFETPKFLHALFAHDINELNYAEQVFGVQLVSRDGWLKATGSADAVALVKRAFADLESALRGGAEISRREFRMAIDLAQQQAQNRLSDMNKILLLGRGGRRGVRPKSPQQQKYLEALESHDVVFALGPAGTGKTYLAMAMGLAMLKSRAVNRLVLTRPAVEAGEALGFLPGDLQDKVAPYLRPLYDALYDMLTPEEGNRLLEDGTIEIAPLAYMRGRTLARSFVILDEAQNTTCEQMFMFLTRLGEESRCVITGDGSQIDLKRGQPSGLLEAELALKSVEGISMIRFGGVDVVRHPVVARIISAYGVHRRSSE